MGMSYVKMAIPVGKWAENHEHVGFSRRSSINSHSHTHIICATVKTWYWFHGHQFRGYRSSRLPIASHSGSSLLAKKKMDYINIYLYVYVFLYIVEYHVYLYLYIYIYIDRIYIPIWGSFKSGEQAGLTCSGPEKQAPKTHSNCRHCGPERHAAVRKSKHPKRTLTVDIAVRKDMQRSGKASTQNVL